MEEAVRNLIKVSVIIPVYNAERYLRECLNSLKYQTLHDIEIIMVNDGSTDSSREICQCYVSDDSRFRLIDQENGGSASARRTGMLAACGEYLGFIDSDDWAEHEMFEKMYYTAVQNDIDIIFCNCYRNDGEKQIECKAYLRNGLFNRTEIKNEILPFSLSYINRNGTNGVIRWANYLRLYRRSMIEEHQIYNDPRFRRCQDLQLTFEATLKAQRYYYMGDEYLYHNRVVRGSQSRGYTKNQWQKIRILIERLYEVVDGFNEMDLREQMDLCAFFFAVYSCENEERECGEVSNEQRQKNLESILNDPLRERYINTIPFGKLSRINQAYYVGIKNQNVSQIRKANAMNNSFRKKHERKERLLANPIISLIHRLIRRDKSLGQK